MSKTARQPLTGMILGTLFTLTVSVLGLTFSVVSVAEWASGKSPLFGMILSVFAGLFVAITFGLFPLWNQYVTPRLRSE